MGNSVDTRVIWRVRHMNCDGGMLGRVWQEWFMRTEEEANVGMLHEVTTRNATELRRDRAYARYAAATVEGLQGYASWQYGTMFAVDSITVPV
jgi:hypothetical protein